MGEYSHYRPKKQLKGVTPRTRLSRDNMELIGIPREFWDIPVPNEYGVLKQDSPSIAKVFLNYVQGIHDAYESGLSLFLFGSNGTGKTQMASIIAREAYRHRYTVKFTTMNKLVPIGTSKYDEEMVAEYYSSYMNVDFLVIDEIGKEQEGEKKANHTVLEEVLRHRDFRRLPTVVITNLDSDDFASRYGQSIYSLIHRFVPIRMVGDDRRKTVRQKELLRKLTEQT